MTAPLNPIARVANGGLGLSVGGGYNFNSRHAIVGDFMWNHFTATNEALAPIRAALQTANVNGGGNLLAFTTNYRFELQRHGAGTYIIAGGGLYHRNAGVNRPIPTGTTITCQPGWRLFGFNCTSDTVFSDRTVVSSSSNTFGVDGGIGFTAHVGEPSYRFYMEARYHYAPSPTINTQIVAVTIGIRY
jgi:hypothetical protein